MPCFYVVDAAQVNPVRPGGIAAAYDAFANGYYILGCNAVQQAFFDKLINKDYVLQA